MIHLPPADDAMAAIVIVGLEDQVFSVGTIKRQQVDGFPMVGRTARAQQPGPRHMLLRGGHFLWRGCLASTRISKQREGRFLIWQMRAKRIDHDTSPARPRTRQGMVDEGGTVTR